MFADMVDHIFSKIFIISPVLIVKSTSDLENLFSVLCLRNHIIGIMFMVFHLNFKPTIDKGMDKVIDSVCVVVDPSSAETKVNPKTQLQKKKKRKERE